MKRTVLSVIFWDSRFRLTFLAAETQNGAAREAPGV